jgi:hypothetical protein
MQSYLMIILSVECDDVKIEDGALRSEQTKNSEKAAGK